jgi:hypothetical protein
MAKVRTGGSIPQLILIAWPLIRRRGTFPFTFTLYVVSSFYIHYILKTNRRRRVRYAEWRNKYANAHGIAIGMVGTLVQYAMMPSEWLYERSSWERISL